MACRAYFADRLKVNFNTVQRTYDASLLLLLHFLSTHAHKHAHTHTHTHAHTHCSFMAGFLVLMLLE